MIRSERARLALVDGTVYEGQSIGARGESGGEVVFNTSMTGYQEILTDPSYRGQIVTMTYPLIGNTGTVNEDDESARPWVEGFIVREMSPMDSNFRCTEPLPEWLERHGIVGIAGLDTRALTRRIRKLGAMAGLISTADVSDEELIERARLVPDLEGRDLVADVTRSEVEEWTRGYDADFAPALEAGAAEGDEPPHVVVVDYGCKSNILRSLVMCGFRVTVVPARTSAEDILSRQPAGVMLSNGPGDPRALGHAVSTVKDLLGRVPIMGICFGHQILGAALGAKIYKLRFGHHGGNHPVKIIGTGRVAVTAQNHGFALDEESLLSCGARITHVNLNDDTVAGIEVPDRRAFGIQFHPEASPGPHESLEIFGQFRRMISGDPEGVSCP